MKHFIPLLCFFVFFTLTSCDPGNELQVETHDSPVYETELKDNWQLFSSDELEQTGENISTAGFDDDYGYPVTLPATVVHGLMQNGYYPDVFEPFVLENLDKEPYEVPWWYRTEFEAELEDGFENYQITFDGINFKANIWLNGQLVADEEQIQGSYGVWNFDISDYVQAGNNILAVEIIPPVFGEDISKGFVDWNPTPPDRSMGLWRGVFLKKTGPVSIRHTNVVSSVDTETLDLARLTVSTRARNHTSEPQEVTFRADFEDYTLTMNETLAPNEEREIFFRPDDYDELVIENPELWWPNNMGEQHLHDLNMSADLGYGRSDQESLRFGIREIDDFWNEDEHRGFKVNGKKVLVKSAGWVDDVFLADPDEKVNAQMRYAKELNLNSIRLEAFWGRNRTLFDRADEYGLLLMLGWTAHWEWESYTGIPHDEYVTIRGTEEKTLHANNYRDQVLWHRHHPSVAIWTYGSDKLPRPDLERMLDERMAKADTTRPILSYCGGAMLMGDSDPRMSEISGPSGVKMEGPYDWVPPIYWYIDDRYGGAFGFNTETGPGPQIPPMPSIERMIPEENRWPIDDVWLYYSGRNQFENLDRFLGAFNSRYGESDNLEEFLHKNQMASYEAMRPMFEAFAVNKYHATGVVQWMYNSAWPTLYWQLFDYYLMPNGAYFATKKAAAPLLPIYNYDDQNIYLNNDFLESRDDLTLKTTVMDLSSNVLFADERSLDIAGNSSELALEMPEIEELTTTYFMDLRLLDENGDEIENNFYWLSTVDDVPDFDETTWYWTPNKQHADLTDLNSMPKTTVDFSYDVSQNGEEYVIEAKIDNSTDMLAFFIELIVMDERSGEAVLPVYWDDNYISLLPGEQRILKAVVSSDDVNRSDIDVKIGGWNVE